MKVSKMILRLVKGSSIAIFIAMSLTGSAALSEPSLRQGELITALGVVTRIDGNGAFTIDASEYSFRIHGIEVHDGILPNEFVGQRVYCRSVLTLQEIQNSGYSEEVIAARCQFYSLFLRSDIGDALINLGLARRVCDPEQIFPEFCTAEKSK